MKQIDLIALTFGSLWGVITYVLLRANKLKPQKWPWIWGLGVAIYVFMSSMTASILSRPATQFLNYTATDLILSLVAGVVAYCSGQIFARRFGKKPN